MNLYIEMQQWILHAPLQQKTVMGLFDSGNLLDVDRHVWFDNWFNSVELLLEMLARDTYGSGAVRTNRKDLPKAVVANM